MGSPITIRLIKSLHTQMTSEFSTKKGESSLARISCASASGPAVPRGSVSTEKVIRTLYSSSYYDQRGSMSKIPS